jgi:RNA polymerase sigma-70 factor (sigma-E family)
MDADTAFIELVSVRSTALLRTAYLLTGDRALAEDLLQESLFAVYRSRQRVRELGALEGYVRTTMVRTLISWRRRRSSREMPHAEPPDGGGLAEEPAAFGETWQVLSTLSARQRAVIVLAYYEDLPETQIADLLGCSVGSVKSHRARALASLRERLPQARMSGTEGLP